MAKTARSPKVGDYVYKPYEPMNPGKVTKVSRSHRNPFGNPPDDTLNTYATVVFMDGEVAEIWDNQLNDFDHLTDEHLKKFKKFDGFRQKLADLEEEE